MTRFPETTERVPGHTLWLEGAVVGDNARYWTTSGDGPGECSCGERSPQLPSANARKRWHRQHKAAILSAAS